jgi:hypothetical protein
LLVVGFSARSTLDDITFAIRLEVDPEVAPSQVVAVLTSHDETESAWIASFPLARRSGTESWSGSLGWSPSDAPDLVSLSAVQIPPMGAPLEGSAPPMEPTVVAVDRSHVLGKPGGDGTGDWVDGSLALEALVAHRDLSFDVELVAPFATASDPLWSVAVLVEHVLLTGPTRVPGIRVLPLQRESNSARLDATAGLLTALAAEVGMSANGAISFSATDRPLAVVVVPRLRSTMGSEAMQEAAQLSRRLLDIIGLNRGDSPAVLAAAVGRYQADGTVVLEGATTLDRRYSGNLIGGFISGESISGLNRQWRQVQADSRISLWLRLFNEALADSRWDYGAFRCFNLLEGIAKEVLPKNDPLYDDAGAPRLQGDGASPYTSAHARGAVYLVLKRAGYVMPTVGQADGSSAQADLWKEIALWVAIRNEVAHTGSWEKPTGQVPTAAWSRHNARLDTPEGAWDVARALQSAAESVLHAAFAGRI